jgi:hypothetical protein
MWEVWRCPGRGVASFVIAVLMVAATVVVDLAVTAVGTPVAASAATNPVIAYVVNTGENTVTPIDVATNIPGPPSTSATARSRSRSLPTVQPPTSSTEATSR